VWSRGLLFRAGPAVPGIGRRLICMAYEALLVFAVAFLAGAAFHGAAVERLTGDTRLVFQVYLFLVLGIYFVVCWSRGGQTLAMQTWRMRIVGRDGASISVARAALRYALAWVSLASLGAGFLWACVDSNGQFLHDRLAGTRIVTSVEPP
jgi:uncharacterized RDD family membrane protein YckC